MGAEGQDDKTISTKVSPEDFERVVNLATKNKLEGEKNTTVAAVLSFALQEHFSRLDRNEARRNARAQ